jgi:hypothetical protein
MQDNDTRKASSDPVRADAKGQFARKQAGGKNSGVSSAAPRVISHEEDATFHNEPHGKPLGSLDDDIARRK